MRLILLLCLLMAASCGAKKSSSFKYGSTLRSDLVALKGEPEREEVIPGGGKMMIYSGDEKYQLKDDVVMNSFKNPMGDEKLLLFWKHKFKDCKTVRTELARIPGAHTPPEVELSCPEVGQSVIYTEGSDMISRVVEYEQK